MNSSVKQVRSEIQRIKNALVSGLNDEEMILPSRVESMLVKIHEDLYPLADSVDVTNVRKSLINDLDELVEAAESYLSGVDTEALEECVAHALGHISRIETGTTKAELRDMVVFERSKLQKRMSVRNDKSSTKRISEAPELQSGNVQKYANESVDVALDAYFSKVGDTLDATGKANKEPAQQGEGEQEFSSVDFARDIANLLDRLDTLIDINGTVGRRAINYVYEKWGADAAQNVKQVLSANFDVEIDTDAAAKDDRAASRPAAIGAGGSGGAAGGA